MRQTRVFLIDDHGVLRQGLRLLVNAQPDMKVVGDAVTGSGATDAIRRAGGADVVVLDISMAGVAGQQAAMQLHEELPSTRVVALTRLSGDASVQQMLHSGASGYVLKQTAGDVLITAIRTVARGGTYVDPAIAELADASLLASQGMRSSELTAREREVLVLVAYGHTNKEMAEMLGIAVKTIETHKANGMAKLALATRAELVHFALAHGWLEPQ